MTRAELDAALAQAEAATNRWSEYISRSGTVLHVRSPEDDAELIAASRTLVPALVAECLRWRRRWALEHVDVAECVVGHHVYPCSECEEAQAILAEGK